MSGIVARIAHWKSTAAGLVIGGVVWYVFTAFGCKLPSDSAAYIGIFAGLLPVIQGALSKG